MMTRRNSDSCTRERLAKHDEAEAPTKCTVTTTSTVVSSRVPTSQGTLATSATDAPRGDDGVEEGSDPEVGQETQGIDRIQTANGGERHATYHPRFAASMTPFVSVKPSHGKDHRDKLEPEKRSIQMERMEFAKRQVVDVAGEEKGGNAPEVDTKTTRSFRSNSEENKKQENGDNDDNDDDDNDNDDDDDDNDDDDDDSDDDDDDSDDYYDDNYKNNEEGENKGLNPQIVEVVENDDETFVSALSSTGIRGVFDQPTGDELNRKVSKNLDEDSQESKSRRLFENGDALITQVSETLGNHNHEGSSDPLCSTLVQRNQQNQIVRSPNTNGSLGTTLPVPHQGTTSLIPGEGQKVLQLHVSCSNANNRDHDVFSSVESRVCTVIHPDLQTFFSVRQTGILTVMIDTSCMNCGHPACECTKISSVSSSSQVKRRVISDWKDAEWGTGKYEGTVSSDKEEPQGKGVFVVEDQVRGLWKKYDGDWSYGKRSGSGKAIWKRKTSKGEQEEVYHGEFSNGYRHGRGIHMFENGAVYDGEWVNDRRQGPGTFRASSGEVCFVGYWRIDKPKTSVPFPFRVFRAKRRMTRMAKKMVSWGSGREGEGESVTGHESNSVSSSLMHVNNF